jgi:Rrf2 family protein
MELIRRNTDYGLRMMTFLATHSANGEVISASRLASENKIPYELGRKLLQKLCKAKLLESVRGLNGGFRLIKKPSEISLWDVITILQGEIYMNKCQADKHECELASACQVTGALKNIQQLLNDQLKGLSLKQVLQTTPKEEQKQDSLTMLIGI